MLVCQCLSTLRRFPLFRVSVMGGFTVAIVDVCSDYILFCGGCNLIGGEHDFYLEVQVVPVLPSVLPLQETQEDHHDLVIHLVHLAG